MTNRSPVFGILSTAPPTPCGIATFTTALGSSLLQRGIGVNLVRILDRSELGTTAPLRVTSELLASDPSSMSRSVDALNRCDVAVIQHEYGLYGGRDGSDVLHILRHLRVPTIAILHTVLPSPTPNQWRVLNEVIARADAVVVMTSAAAKLLRQVNVVGNTPIDVIPHGAATPSASLARTSAASVQFLTWGLIGPGKGIEWAIDALPKLRDLVPPPQYVISGRTHPKVLAAAGEAYRTMLEGRVVANGVRDLVRFDNTYRDLEALGALIAAADVVILPYDTSDQATSGVLVDAVAAGKPVIATSFPHSRELLGGGAGIIVPHRDPAALAGAMRQVVTDQSFTSGMILQAQRLAPSLSWDSVADQYIDVAHRYLAFAGVGA